MILLVWHHRPVMWPSPHTHHHTWVGHPRVSPFSLLCRLLFSTFWSCSYGIAGDPYLCRWFHPNRGRSQHRLLEQPVNVMVYSFFIVALSVPRVRAGFHQHSPQNLAILTQCILHFFGLCIDPKWLFLFLWSVPQAIGGWGPCWNHSTNSGYWISDLLITDPAT